MKKDAKMVSRVKRLTEMFNGKGNLLIIVQDNPDPDAIAAAVALRHIAHVKGDIQCSIAHGGMVGRSENRALVKYLGVNLRHMDQIDMSAFDLVGMVDTQPGTGNNSLPTEVIPDIVIDHHPFRRLTREAPLYDVRRHYGATCTILLEYLLTMKMIPDTPLGTALLYGIRSDTQDLGREATRADIEAIALLFPIANKRMLSEIQRGKVTRDYFQMLSNALQNAWVCRKCVLTNLGEIEYPDMIAEVADLLLRDDETTWALCYGYAQGKAYFSIRTSEIQPSAEKVAKRIVARRGTAGGHVTYAGGQIPLKKGTKRERADIDKLIPQKMLSALGITSSNWTRLVSPRKNGSS